MKKILNLGNTMNQGTARGKILAFRIILIHIYLHILILINVCPFLLTGSAVGFRLDSLLKLADTRGKDSKVTLMHYLCKV